MGELMSEIPVGSWKVREDNPAFPNEAFVDIPNGYIEIGGSRFGRERAARLIAEVPAMLVELIRLRAIEAAAREYLAALDAFRDDGTSSTWATGVLQRCLTAKESLRAALEGK